MKAVEFIGAVPIFAKYMNQFSGAKLCATGEDMVVETSPCFSGCRQECMRSFGESLEKLAPDVKVHFNTPV